MTVVLAALDPAFQCTRVVADSATDTQDRRYITGDKLITLKGNVVVGTAGDVHVVQHCLRLLPDKWDLVKWSDAVRNVEWKERDDAVILVVDGRDLYLMGIDGSVIRPDEDWVAIGAGSGYAEGAMKALQKMHPDRSVHNWMNVSVYVAESLCPSVRRPWRWEEVKW